jgi:hypothetical protein
VVGRQYSDEEQDDGQLDDAKRGRVQDLRGEATLPGVSR